MTARYFEDVGWVRPDSEQTPFWCIRTGNEQPLPIFPLPSPDLTAFPPGQPSYTYDALVANARGQAPPPPVPPPQPQPEVAFSPPRMSHSVPHVDSDPVWDLQSIGQALGRIEHSHTNLRRMVGSIDQRLGYLERNQGRALYPMYDDYARRGNIPDDAIHPDWFQPPPQGYDRDPTARGIYTDYSSFFGYGQDIPFGGPAGGVFTLIILVVALLVQVVQVAVEVRASARWTRMMRTSYAGLVSEPMRTLSDSGLGEILVWYISFSLFFYFWCVFLG